MASFSQRRGLKPLEKLIQLDSLDPESRNRLWNVLYNSILHEAQHIYVFARAQDAKRAHDFACKVWSDFFKLPSDAAPDALRCVNPLRRHFEQAEWNEVYDLMEFSIANLPSFLVKPVTEQWNKVLEQENAGYRIIGCQVVEITA